MTRRRRHALAACGVTLALAAAAVAGLTLSGTGQHDRCARRSGEMPTALGAHLAELSQAIPGNGGEAAGRARQRPRRQEFAARAYPDTDISLAKIQAKSRAAGASAEGPTVPERQGQARGRGSRSARARRSTRSRQFRNSFSYVPNEYSPAGARPSLAIGPTCKPGNCRLWLGAAGGGVWRTKNALTGNPNWEFLSGSFGIKAIGSIIVDPNDPSGNTIYVGTGEANCVRRLAPRASGSTSRRTAATRGRARSARACSTPARIGAIAVKPGSPNTSTSATTRAVRGIVVGLLRAACRSSRAPRSGASTSRRTAARAGRSSTTAPRRRASAPVTRPSPTTAHRARRAASATWSSTRRTRTSSTPARTPAGSGARPTAARPGRRSSRRSTPREHQTRPRFAVTTLPNGKTRMYVYEGNAGSAVLAALPLATTSRTGVPVFTDLTSANVADHRLRDVQPLHRAVLVRRLRLHAQGSSRTSSTPAAPTPTARRRSRTSAA